MFQIFAGKCPGLISFIDLDLPDFIGRRRDEKIMLYRQQTFPEFASGTMKQFDVGLDVFINLLYFIKSLKQIGQKSVVEM